MVSNTVLQKEEQNYVINPKKFVLWLLIVASVMLFAGFTSAYIVRRGEGNWEIFNLPTFFAINTVLIILSSIFLQLSYMAAKKDKLSQVKSFLLVSFLIGVGFVFGQFFAWNQLVADNVFFSFSNPSNAFVYVISGVHLFHVLGGLVFMLLMVVASFRNKIHKLSLLYLNMCLTYWHFIGILWIYLYLFLYLYR
ncbi:MAG: cytochrome c oxidase subunit 3 [Bacteroidia bacterium]|nr:cytochrome c oxidase subunit 3 [Bacteroidia bacterium]MCF8445502.1 cytochrome c oxidase subunit 3 [Bacteroidia bacterium]